MGIAGKIRKMTGSLATVLLGVRYVSCYKKDPVRADTGGDGAGIPGGMPD